jgi:hypothetical protein
MPPSNQELNQRKALIICQQYAQEEQDYRQSMRELTRMGLSDELADHLLAEARHGANEQHLRDQGLHPGQLQGEADAPLPERTLESETIYPDDSEEDPSDDSA